MQIIIHFSVSEDEQVSLLTHDTRVRLDKRPISGMNESHNTTEQSCKWKNIQINRADYFCITREIVKTTPLQFQCIDEFNYLASFLFIHCYQTYGYTCNKTV